MKNLITLITIIFLYNSSAGQFREYEEKIDSIPNEPRNESFLRALKNYWSLPKVRNADTSFVLYEYNYYSHYAIIWWRKGNKVSCRAFIEYSPGVSKIEDQPIKNVKIDRVDVFGLYKVMADSAVRIQDTTIFVSHNDPVYFRFAFGNSIKFLVGYQFPVLPRLDRDFVNAFNSEENKIYARKLEENKEKRKK